MKLSLDVDKIKKALVDKLTTVKFNPNHDADGQFASGSGGGARGSGSDSDMAYGAGTSIPGDGPKKGQVVNRKQSKNDKEFKKYDEKARSEFHNVLGNKAVVWGMQGDTAKNVSVNGFIHKKHSVDNIIAKAVKNEWKDSGTKGDYHILKKEKHEFWLGKDKGNAIRYDGQRIVVLHASF